MFTLFSLFSTRLAQKIGLEHLFTYSLFFLTIGSLIRLINLPLLYLGTLMVGASIAVINVLLPSLIQANQPKKIGFLTTLYVTSMGIATALASYLAVPITQASSWKGLIILLTLLCLATFWSGCQITAIITDWLLKPNKKAKQRSCVINRSGQ